MGTYTSPACLHAACPSFSSMLLRIPLAIRAPKALLIILPQYRMALRNPTSFRLYHFDIKNRAPGKKAASAKPKKKRVSNAPTKLNTISQDFRSRGKEGKTQTLSWFLQDMYIRQKLTWRDWIDYLLTPISSPKQACRREDIGMVFRPSWGTCCYLFEFLGCWRRRMIWRLTRVFAWWYIQHTG